MAKTTIAAMMIGKNELLLVIGSAIAKSKYLILFPFYSSVKYKPRALISDNDTINIAFIISGG